MDESRILAENVKRIRQEKKMSLGQLADKCGLSKMVLSQIEKGDSNPTLSTMWKIASGLGVPYTTLLDANMQTADVKHRSAVPSGVEEDGCYRSYTYYSAGADCPFDFFAIELDPGTSRESIHNETSTEYAYVEQGSLELKIGDEIHSLIEGDSIKFDASKPHRYSNPGRTLLKVVSLVTY